LSVAMVFAIEVSALLECSEEGRDLSNTSSTDQSNLVTSVNGTWIAIAFLLNVAYALLNLTYAVTLSSTSLQLSNVVLSPIGLVYILSIYFQPCQEGHYERFFLPGHFFPFVVISEVRQRA